MHLLSENYYFEACKPKNRFSRPSRCLISDRGWGGLWLDCWCVIAWSSGVDLLFFISTPSGCAITSRMLTQASTVVIVLSGVCIASSSYYMQVYLKRKEKEEILLLSPCCFMFRCLCGRKKTKQLWLFKIYFQHISVPFIFFLVVTFAMLFKFSHNKSAVRTSFCRFFLFLFFCGLCSLTSWTKSQNNKVLNWGTDDG